MSNKLTNKETKDISIKLRWSLKNTKKAIKEYKNVESIVNHDQLLRTCLNSYNPIDRISNIAELLTLKVDDSIENILLKILDIDHLLNVLRVFNIEDMESNNNIKVEDYFIKITKKNEYVDEQVENKDIDEISDVQSTDELDERMLKVFYNEIIKNIKGEVSRVSFLRFPQLVLVKPRNFDNFEGLIDGDLLLQKYVNRTDLANDLCNIYLKFKLERPYNTKMDEIEKLSNTNFHKESSKISYTFHDEVEELIIKLIPIKHFELLNIPFIENYITIRHNLMFIPSCKTFIKKIHKLYLDVDTNRNEITDKQYWFYYCLIEKIKEKGYKTQPASKIAERLLNLTETGSIRSRYYSKKKIVDKDKNFKLDDFIYKQGFTEPIYDFLNKVERV